MDASIAQRGEGDASAQRGGADVLLHGLLRRAGGMPRQGLEYLAMLLPGLHRSLRADERQLLALQKDIGAGGDQGEHRLVAAGGEDALVELEIQPRRLLEIFGAQLAAIRAPADFVDLEAIPLDRLAQALDPLVADDGQPRKLEFRIKLKAYGEDQP